MTSNDSRCLSHGDVQACASFAAAAASTVRLYNFAACSCSIAMAEFRKIFLPILSCSADGQGRTFAVRSATIADDFGLAEVERAGVVTRRCTIA